MASAIYRPCFSACLYLQISGVGMTQDEIIAMARQVGLWPAVTDTFPKELVAFFALVAAHEREACAKLVEPTEEHRKEPLNYIGGEEGVELLDNLAAEIRARGNT